MNRVLIKKGLVTICKIDEVLQIVKGVVYQPNVVDSQDDWMSDIEIRKAAHTFMKNMNLQNVDTNHDLNPIEAFVCESFIAKANDPEGFPEGSWVVAVKIEDADIWQGVLNGDFGGFSMFGKGFGYDGVEPPTN